MLIVTVCYYCIFNFFEIKPHTIKFHSFTPTPQLVRFVFFGLLFLLFAAIMTQRWWWGFISFIHLHLFLFLLFAAPQWWWWGSFIHIFAFVFVLVLFLFNICFMMMRFFYMYIWFCFCSCYCLLSFYYVIFVFHDDSKVMVILKEL